jgi:hypothetical protein
MFQKLSLTNMIVNIMLTEMILVMAPTGLICALISMAKADSNNSNELLE